jgi:Ca-activated chloride channel family protein
MAVIFRCVVGAVLALAPVAAASAADRTIVVLDASGSMWGQIGGRPKQMIAREALKTALQSLPADREVGLMAYGHRDKASCEDIELVVPPAAGSAGAMAAAADQLKFVGKTPLAAAVRKAADDLDYTANKATIVVLADGPDSCNADPCALGRELEQGGTDVTVHVVGLGMTAEQARQVACLAETTGGRYIHAGDAAQLAEALRQTLIAAPEPTPPAPAVGVEQEPASEAAPAVVPEQPEFNFMPSVAMAQGGPPLTDAGPSYEIYRANADGGAGERVGIEFSPYKGSLPPGDYVVRATLGEASVEQPLKVEPGKTYQPLYVLDAGTLIVRPRGSGGGDVSRAASVVIDYPGAPFPATYYGEARAVLPAGAQKVTVRIGSAEASETIDLAAGQTVEKDLAVEVGHLRVNALYKAGGEKIGTSGLAIRIFKAQKEPGGSPEEAAYGYGVDSAYDLPPGDYTVLATLDRAEAWAPASIRVGAQLDVTVVLDAGTLSVKAPGANAIEVFTTAGNGQADRKSFASGYGDTLATTLPAGDYLVMARRGDGAGKEMAVTVEAGERTELTVP